MKTIGELEAELVEIKSQADEAWGQVKTHREVYDKALSVWLPLQQRFEKMQETLGIRKEIEAAQCSHQWEIISNADQPAKGRCVKCGEEP